MGNLYLTFKQDVWINNAYFYTKSLNVEEGIR